MKLIKFIDRLIVYVSKKAFTFGQYCFNCTNFQLPYLLLIMSFVGAISFFILTYVVGMHKVAFGIFLYTCAILGLSFGGVKVFHTLHSQCIEKGGVQIDNTTNNLFRFLRIGLSVLVCMVAIPIIRNIFQNSLGSITVVILTFTAVQTFPFFAFLLASVKLEEAGQ